MSAEAPSDRDLVERANRGDETAFEELYHRHKTWVVRLARRYTRDDDLALDALQEVFAYLLRKIPGLVLTAAFRTFLFPVVKNTALNARKRATRAAGEDAASEELEAAAPQDDPADDLDHLLGGLADGQRDVVLLRFVDGLSLQEVAETLAIPVGTVKSRLHNALETLRGDPRTRRYWEGFP